MICKTCGETLPDGEYRCEVCGSIFDIEKYEESVDKKAEEIRARGETVKLKTGYIICEKCGKLIKAGRLLCKHCGFIIDMDEYERVQKELSAEVIEEHKTKELMKNSKGLQALCFLTPLIGLILWAVYKRKNKPLAEICYSMWLEGLGYVRWIMYLLCYFGISGVIDLF